MSNNNNDNNNDNNYNIKETRKIIETKLHCRNIIKGTNSKAVRVVRYSGLFLK